MKLKKFKLSNSEKKNFEKELGPTWNGVFYLQFTSLEERVSFGDTLCEKQRKKEGKRDIKKC